MTCHIDNPYNPAAWISEQDAIERQNRKAAEEREIERDFEQVKLSQTQEA